MLLISKMPHALTVPTGCTHVQRIGPGRYQITSQTDSTETYTYTIHTMTCTCAAGEHGRFCWHWGAALAGRDFHRLFEARVGRTPRHGCLISPAGTIKPASVFDAIDLAGVTPKGA